MTLSGRRTAAIVRKELIVYRRSASIVFTMALVPLIFMVQPLVSVFAAGAAAAAVARHHHELLYLLAIPALVPALVAAYSVVGERQQGTLEPLLITPISREELVLGKALAVLGPCIVVSYFVFAVFIGVVELFADPGVASALIQPSDVIAQVIFTPLIAAASIWLAMAISTRASDVRVAQQLSVLASLPAVALAALIALNVIHPTLEVAFAIGVGLLIAIRLGWRLVSALFDRERLVASIR